jgi:site-specific DNA recombinase
MASGTGPRVAIYVRQSDFGQETALRVFAHSQPGDWHIVKVYTDSGHTSVARDGARMVRDARNGVFNTLLVHNLDRLSRNLNCLAQLLDDLADANVAVRSATEPMFDTTTPVGRLMVSMLGVSAEMERMRRRVSAAQSRPANTQGRRDG